MDAVQSQINFSVTGIPESQTDLGASADQTATMRPRGVGQSVLSAPELGGRRVQRWACARRLS